jgi:hypothetical protein
LLLCLLVALQVVMSVSALASPDHSKGSAALEVLGLLAFLCLCACLGLLKLRAVSAALRLVDAARFLPLYQVGTRQFLLVRCSFYRNKLLNSTQACSVASSVLCGVVFLQERDEVAHPFFYALGAACVCLGTAARALRHPCVRAHIEAAPALRLDLADRASLSRARLAGALRCCCCCWPFAAQAAEGGAEEGERETHNLLGSAASASSSHSK